MIVYLLVCPGFLTIGSLLTLDVVQLPHKVKGPRHERQITGFTSTSVAWTGLLIHFDSFHMLQVKFTFCCFLPILFWGSCDFKTSQKDHVILRFGYQQLPWLRRRLVFAFADLVRIYLETPHSSFVMFSFYTSKTDCN